MTALRKRAPIPVPSKARTAEGTDWGSVRSALRDWLVDYPCGRAWWLEPVPAEDIAQEAVARCLARKRQPSEAKMMPVLQRLALRVLFPNHEDQITYEPPRYPTPKTTSYLDDPFERIFVWELAEAVIDECSEQDRRIWQAFKDSATGDGLAKPRDVANDLAIDIREVRSFIKRAKRSYKVLLERITGGSMSVPAGQANLLKGVL